MALAKAVVVLEVEAPNFCSLMVDLANPGFEILASAAFRSKISKAHYVG